MSSLDSIELIEGDLMYLHYLTYIKEEIQISSDESDSVKIDYFSDSEISNEIKQQIQNEKEEIQVDDNKVVSVKPVNDHNDSSDNCQTASEKEPSNEVLHSIHEEEITDRNIHQNISQKTCKRKQRFSSKNLIDMYCHDCKKVRKRVWGDKRTKCKKCQVSLKYQCAKCKKRYKTYKKAVSHVKRKCYQTSLYQCSRCNFEAQNKENLNIHVQSRHSFQKCSACNIEYESNQILKHQLYDCKFWNNQSNAGNNSETQVLTANENESSTTRKLTPKKCSLLLERYCKTCDRTTEKVRGINICNNCKSSFLYQCIICCNRYSSMVCAYQHIRCCIQLVKFHCSECRFETVYKTSLTKHVENKHVLQECEVCDVICENRKSLSKHKKYECKRNQRTKKNK